MRITIVADSATPAEVMALTSSFQRAVKHDGLPEQITTEPTVQVLGSAMTWTSPAMHLSTAAGVLVNEGLSVAEESDEPKADGEHAWFLNEDGEPYMYERDNQQAAFPNDPEDAYDSKAEAVAASLVVSNPDSDDVAWWDFETETEAAHCFYLDRHECSGRVGVRRSKAMFTSVPDTFDNRMNPLNFPRTGWVMCEYHVNNRPGEK